MISQKLDNGLERRVMFRPGYHKVHTDPKKNYGVHGMEIWMYVVGPKGAVHFGFMTGMHLPETYKWWKNNGHKHGIVEVSEFQSMGIDVGYHAYEKQYEDDEIRQPKKMIRKDESIPFFNDLPKDATNDDREKALSNIEWVNKFPEPPNCEILGVPCYCDGSAIRGGEFRDILVAEGDDVIWRLLEEDYQSRFGS